MYWFPFPALTFELIAIAAAAGISCVCWTAWVTVARLRTRAPQLTLTQFLVVVPLIAAVLAISASFDELAIELLALAGAIQITLGYVLAASFSDRPSAADALVGGLLGLFVLAVFTVWWAWVVIWLL